MKNQIQWQFVIDVFLDLAYTGGATDVLTANVMTMDMRSALHENKEKGYIVVDVPEKCNQCLFWFAKATMPIEYRCLATQRELEDIHDRPVWCPIQEIPQKTSQELNEAIIRLL